MQAADGQNNPDWLEPKDNREIARSRGSRAAIRNIETSNT